MRFFIALLILGLSCMPGGCQQKIAEKIGEKVVEKTVGGISKKDWEDVDIGKNVNIPTELKGYVPEGFKAKASIKTKEKGMMLAGVVSKPPERIKEFYINILGEPSGEITSENQIWLSWEDKEIVVVIRGSGNSSDVVITKGKENKR